MSKDQPLKERVQDALRNAAESGYTFEGWSPMAIATDMITFDADLEDESVLAVANVVSELRPSFWHGKIREQDDFGDRVENEFIDGRSRQGPWGIFTPASWKQHGCGQLGVGCGQRYVRQDDGRWLKVEG